jgi:hypothetical protein
MLRKSPHSIIQRIKIQTLTDKAPRLSKSFIDSSGVSQSLLSGENSGVVVPEFVVQKTEFSPLSEQEKAGG